MRRRNKSNAKSTVFEGHRYASLLEVRYAKHLNLLVAAGEVDRWLPHPIRMPLVCNEVKVGVYTPDFQVWKGDTSWYVDTKGFPERGWPFRLKIIMCCYPRLDLRIVKGKDF